MDRNNKLVEAMKHLENAQGALRWEDRPAGQKAYDRISEAMMWLKTIAYAPAQGPKKTIGVRFPPQVAKAIEALAKGRGESMSDVVRAIVERGLNEDSDT